VEAVTAELEAAGKLRTSFGAMAVFLAQRISAAGYDTGSAIAALSKELREVMAKALEGVQLGDAPLKELERRRDAKRARWPVS
jgi:uncharacterized protein YoaH (UPF0181 family)